MFRTIGLITALMWVMACVASPPIKAEETRRPNIILIMADDMGYETVGANGGLSYRTPRLDELARTGMRFDEAHALPLCTPSRVQIMSGRYNSRNYTGFGEMDPGIYTFGNLFQEAGYATFIGGKWQLGGDLEAPHRFGFDEYCLWQLTRKGTGDNPLGNRYPNPTLEVNGRVVTFDQGEYGPDIVSNHVTDFIERHRDKPFFVYYPMILPHWPFEPTPDSPDWDPTARRGDRTERPGQGDTKYFADMVAYTDKIVGRIIDKLDELELRENTLVIFIGDNGTAPGVVSRTRHGEVTGGKRTSTNAGTHVPMIANWPGVVPAGAVNNDLICFTYFFPTLAEIAGIQTPADLSLDGQSFAPVLRGEEAEMRDWMYVWWWAFNTPNNVGGEFARTHRYKLYFSGKFFDLASDPMEQHPLDRNTLSDEQVQMRDRLRQIIEKHTRPGFRKQ